MINLSEILNNEISPFLIGCIMSRFIKKNNCFQIYSAFKSSTKIGDIPNEMACYLCDTYNRVSKINNWEIEKQTISNVKIIFNIFNDINISPLEFYNQIYSKLLNSWWVFDNDINDQKKDFIRGFMETRGSIDTTLKFISQDYFYNNIIELKKAQILCDLVNIPIQFLNINYRELQPQYVNNEIKRNAQLRINLNYYSKFIGFYNTYKASIIQNVYKWKPITNNEIITFDCDIPKINYNSKFIKYINFFTNNIYSKKLNNNLIKRLREDLEFDKKTFTNLRDVSLTKIYDELSEDKCAICKKTKTFKRKNSDRQYFEIHHVISVFNNKELDNIANLIKLCPECHSSLKKGRCSIEQQINNIFLIVSENRSIYEFTSSYLNIKDRIELSKKIQEMLG